MKLKRLLFHNFGWKLASLTFSVLLWFAVVGEPELVTVQSAEVYFENLDSSLVLLTDAPNIQLELRGPSAVVSRENLQTVKILLDLSNVKGPGEQAYAISAEDITLPTGVALMSAVPSRLFLDFDRRTRKNVAVKPEIKGQPAPGYRLVNAWTEPNTVAVSGPESRIRGIDAAQTAEIDITGATANKEVRVNAYVSDPMVQLTSPLVNVRLIIEKGFDNSHP